MTATLADVVEPTLERYGSLIRAAMMEFLAGVGARSPELAEMLADYPRRAGKAIRPALLLATCQAFGGSARDAMGPAVSIEMLHNAFLIHDDIEDDSELRRGLATLHRIHGVPSAINTGDALAMMAMQPLRDRGVLGSRLQERVTDEYLAMAQRTVEGQAQELAWRRDNVIDLAPEDYLSMVGAKTCWYTTIYPLRVGSLIGSRSTVDPGRITEFGFHLGAAFQIRDDLLDLGVEAGRVGKTSLGDLREGKRTLMLIHLLSVARPAERTWLESYLGTPQELRTETDVHRVMSMMGDHGSLQFAASYADGLATAAGDLFTAAFEQAPPSEHKEFLRAMTRFMVERSR